MVQVNRRPPRGRPGGHHVAPRLQIFVCQKFSVSARFDHESPSRQPIGLSAWAEWWFLIIIWLRVIFKVCKGCGLL